MALIHYTRSREALFSILRYGFFYLHNETGLLNRFFGKDFVPEAQAPSGGMVCFTDLAPDHAGHIREKFGEYGIAVKREWALRHGATKVLYVDPDGPVFRALSKIFDEHRPKELQLTGASDINALATAAVWTSPPLLEQAARSRTYIELIRLISWMQGIEEYAESEWRMRSPGESIMVALEQATKGDWVKVYIETIEAALTGGKPKEGAIAVLSLSCPLRREAIEYICVPRAQVESVADQIQVLATRTGNPYSGTKVIANE